MRNGKAELALHHLRRGERPAAAAAARAGRAHARPRSPAHLADWPGPVFGLDFTGHGRSTVPAGGGYTAEVLMADVDAALAELGPATSSAAASAPTSPC